MKGCKKSYLTSVVNINRGALIFHVSKVDVNTHFYRRKNQKKQVGCNRKRLRRKEINLQLFKGLTI